MAALTWQACALRRHPTSNEGIYGPGRRSISITIAVPTLPIIMTERIGTHRITAAAPSFCYQASSSQLIIAGWMHGEWWPCRFSFTASTRAWSMEHVVTASTAHRHIWEFGQVQRQLRARPCSRSGSFRFQISKDQAQISLSHQPIGWRRNRGCSKQASNYSSLASTTVLHE